MAQAPTIEQTDQSFYAWTLQTYHIQDHAQDMRAKIMDKLRVSRSQTRCACEDLRIRRPSRGLTPPARKRNRALRARLPQRKTTASVPAGDVGRVQWKGRRGGGGKGDPVKNLLLLPDL